MFSSSPRPSQQFRLSFQMTRWNAAFLLHAAISPAPALLRNGNTIQYFSIKLYSFYLCAHVFVLFKLLNNIQIGYWSIMFKPNITHYLFNEKTQTKCIYFNAPSKYMGNPERGCCELSTEKSMKQGGMC